MTVKKDLVRRLSENTILTKRESELIINEFIDILIDEVKNGNEVSIVGFGRFYLYEHISRPVRNPKTQERMMLTPYKSLKFRPSNVLKKMLKDMSKSES